MKAIRQYEFVPAEDLLYEDVADPEPAEGQFRVAVEAAGVHLIDTKVRQGESHGRPPELPMTPGREIAGAVEARRRCDHAWLGKRAVGYLGVASGGYAERTVIAVTSMHEIPDHVSAIATVTSIGTGRTTMVALDLAKASEDDVVLVTAAASSMGNLLVQAAARHLGATVIGVAGGAEKVVRVRELGADVAVDYTQPGWPDRVRAARGPAGHAGAGRGRRRGAGPCRRTARARRPDRELRLGIQQPGALDDDSLRE